MEWLIGALALIIAFLSWLLYGATNNRLKDAEQELEDAEQELEEWEGVLDVRRKAEEAKHNDPNAIKRVRERYNDPR